MLEIIGQTRKLTGKLRRIKYLEISKISFGEKLNDDLTIQKNKN